VSERHDRIYGEMRLRLNRELDRTFGWLFALQWVVAIVAALVRNPWETHAISGHVYLAIGLGGALCLAPMIATRRGLSGTRYVIAVCQMLWSALLIVVLGGRSETHFHVLGSLAFLAFYRDWRVLATAAAALIFDHAFRGVMWPYSVYGVVHPAWWRFLEYAAWLTFELAILLVAARRATREMRDAALREASLEQTTATIQRKVENRTRQLEDNAERYRMLVENTEAIPFEYEVAEHRLSYCAPQAARLLECEPAELTEPGFIERTAHPTDNPEVRAAIAAFMRGERSPSAPIDHRMITRRGRTVHVRMFMSSRSGSRLRGVLLDTTHQTLLESELRQAHKLESVGRLASGVAHEINTPIQFVSDSLQFVRAATEDLLTIVARQQAELEAGRAGAWTPALAEATAQAIDEADLPYVRDQLPHALERALDGTQRVSSIVQSMKVFAYDKRELTTVDLRAAIETTLNIARNEYKYVADLELRLDPVPQVTCFAGEINQVILNIVVNAAHAIADAVAGTDRRGKIVVALRQVDASVVISISDSGAGIPAHARDHIFEQFYTTKPVGKGTGQGLALCRSVVVDKHHGALTFETEPGVGTTFHIQIPIVPRSDSSLTVAA
jgi:signal transduction histidine kinase